jgi:xanthine dehydrogenase accessory factor
MVCNNDGEQCGSLSGGCIEEDLLAKVVAGKVPADGASHTIYGATAEEAERFKLPCGGTLGVLIEPLGNTADTRQWLEQVVAAIEKRQCITRDVDWIKNTQALQPGNIGERFQIRREDGAPLSLHQVYGPQFHLLLIGVSEVTRYLASFALMMDYRVSVCDPRPEQIEGWNVEHVSLIQSMPDDAVLAHGNDDRTAILALTHDPRIDDMGLMEAFNTQAFYIGAMGSMATSTKRRDRLQLLGISELALQRLHAPIGLSIGSKTPAEIAIAILAELTGVRAGRH